MQRWRVELFGGLRVLSPGQEGEPITRFRTRKVALLLARLALYSEREQGREELVELFWPEMDTATGRNNLSYTLAALRRQTGAIESTERASGIEIPSLLVAERHAVRLHPTVEVDARQFESLLNLAGQRDREPESRRKLLTEAVALYRGDLLPGVYDDWVIREQERLASRYGAALVSLAEAHWSAEAWPEAADIASKALQQSPENDRAAEIHRAATRQIVNRSVVVAPSAPLKTEDVPPAKNSSHPSPSPTTAGNLPVVLTRLHGRESEVEHIVTLLRNPNPEASRLITITGPGGVGKTRLSLAVAQAVTEQDSRIVPVWGPLAGVATPQQVVPSLATMLGVFKSDHPNQAFTALLKALQESEGKSTLLLLDNAEHLLSNRVSDNDEETTLPEVIHTLLQHLPRLRILVTSRSPLGMDSEQTRALSPLAAPQLEEDTRFPSRGLTEEWLDRITRSPSATLFVERARAARSDFTITTKNAVAVAEICYLLDGLPLAIEMAAAWVRTLSAGQIRNRLREQKHDLLISRRRDAPLRHLSLEATLEWSYQLLSPAHRQFFARLSVFRGGWELEAAEQIGGAGIGDSVPLLLRDLQDHALVTLALESYEKTPSPDNDAMRYRLLEVVRSFAADHLKEDELEAAIIHQQHAVYYASIAGEAELYIHGANRDAWLARIGRELENIRAALDWFEQATSPELGRLYLQFVVSLFEYWMASGRLSEGEARLKTALERAVVAPDSEELAWALLRMGHLLAYMGDGNKAVGYLEQAETIARTQSYLNLLGHILRMKGGLLSFQGRLEESLLIGKESLSAFRQAHEDNGIALALALIADVYMDLKDFKAAIPVLQEVVALYRRLERLDRTGFCLAQLGRALYEIGDIDAAHIPVAEGVVLLRSHGGKNDLSVSLPIAARLAKHSQDYAGARALYCEALQLARAGSYELAVEYMLRGIAGVAVAAGDYEVATRLIGGIQSIRERSAFPNAPFPAGECEAIYDTCESALGRLTALRILGEGRAMTPAETTQFALGTP